MVDIAKRVKKMLGVSRDIMAKTATIIQSGEEGLSSAGATTASTHVESAEMPIYATTTPLRLDQVLDDSSMVDVSASHKPITPRNNYSPDIILSADKKEAKSVAPTTENVKKKGKKTCQGKRKLTDAQKAAKKAKRVAAFMEREAVNTATRATMQVASASSLRALQEATEAREEVERQLAEEELAREQEMRHVEALLGIPLIGSSQQQLKAAFRKAMRENHNDKKNNCPLKPGTSVELTKDERDYNMDLLLTVKKKVLS